jgi:hypothetical protein
MSVEEEKTIHFLGLEDHAEVVAVASYGEESKTLAEAVKNAEDAFNKKASPDECLANGVGSFLDLSNNLQTMTGLNDSLLMNHLVVNLYFASGETGDADQTQKNAWMVDTQTNSKNKLKNKLMLYRPRAHYDNCHVGTGPGKLFETEELRDIAQAWSTSTMPSECVAAYDDIRNRNKLTLKLVALNKRQVSIFDKTCEKIGLFAKIIATDVRTPVVLEAIKHNCLELAEKASKSLLKQVKLSEIVAKKKNVKATTKDTSDKKRLRSAAGDSNEEVEDGGATVKLGGGPKAKVKPYYQLDDVLTMEGRERTRVPHDEVMNDIIDISLASFRLQDYGDRRCVTALIPIRAKTIFREVGDMVTIDEDLTANVDLAVQF